MMMAKMVRTHYRHAPITDALRQARLGSPSPTEAGAGGSDTIDGDSAGGLNAQFPGRLTVAGKGPELTLETAIQHATSRSRPGRQKSRYALY